jgi:hypothetical protein
MTGSGLKDVKTAMRAAGEPVSMAPSDEDLAAYLKEGPLAS